MREKQSTPQPVSAVLNLDQAVDEFRKTVRPLMEPGQESEWDGSKVKKKEFAILQAALRLAGECIAIFIYQLVLTESVKLAAQARVRGQAGIAYTHQAFKEVGITVIGGVQVRVKTLYKLARQRKAGRGRKRKQGKRGRSHGQGFYPVLGLLGISEGVTPLIRCGVAQAATQSVSLEYARQQMTGWGCTLAPVASGASVEPFVKWGFRCGRRSWAASQRARYRLGQPFKANGWSLGWMAGESASASPRAEVGNGKVADMGIRANGKSPNS